MNLHFTSKLFFAKKNKKMLGVRKKNKLK